MHPNVHYSIIHSTVAKIWKQPRCPSTDDCVQEDVMCVYVCVYVCTVEYHSAIKKKGTLPFATTQTDSEVRWCWFSR